MSEKEKLAIEIKEKIALLEEIIAKKEVILEDLKNQLQDLDGE